MGEDVHRLNGGTNGATSGLKEKFPDRVLGTPISENAFTGLGGGIALDGRFHPVVEFMYADFMWVAADQLFNQIGKARHMFGGDQRRAAACCAARSRMGTGYGSQHSMDPAGIFATAAGWRIVAPSTPFDYVGPDEHRAALQGPGGRARDTSTSTSIIGRRARVDDFDYCLPRRQGRGPAGRVGRHGDHLPGDGAPRASRPSSESGVDAEVIDLRWLDRASLDWDTIERQHQEDQQGADRRAGRAAARRTAAGWPTRSSAGTSTGSTRRSQRVTGGEASPSISKVLERAAIASTDDIVDALRSI